jgi:hypothetical protein
MVCFKYIIVRTLHNGENEDDDDDNNDNNNNNEFFSLMCQTVYSLCSGLRELSLRFLWL